MPVFPAKRLFAALLAALLAAAPAQARNTKPGALTVRDIYASSSRAVALKSLKTIPKVKRTPEVLRRVEGLRAVYRVSIIQSGDSEWEQLTSAVNFCVDLVLKTCGPNKECGDTQQCEISLQFLSLYNEIPASDTDARHEFEWNCIASLEDNVIFPACQP